MSVSISYQYDLFEDELKPIDILRKEVEALRDSQDRQRRRLFANDAEMMKIILELKKENEELRRLMMMRIK